MQAREILTLIRAILRDEKAGNYRFEDSLLLSALEREQNTLMSEFEQPIRYFCKQITPKDNFLELPSTCLKVCACFLDNKEIARQSLKNRLKNTTCNLSLVPLSLQVYQVLPTYRANGICELYYISAQGNLSADSTLFLDDIFSLSLVQGCVIQLLSIETHAPNLQKIQLFKQLLKEEKDKLRAMVSRASEPSIIPTPYKLV
ncbi:hypothetical protein CQA49_09205 [Helicobacter sp. MIT 00-7814]|uniref:hypothetical protein n=1 Tax=unclassified Helicobacter TaxID=2593540 RepID=UPI000E1E4CF3|nr:MULTISPECIES: hypothetical protein [unclassified Helicobacter]RDU51762.1 hypothetical protein CQA49_09205 [Helicobacter sp. MIT 00-7814]RDU51773.1 hypothetical protein CQA37_09350 [Helicobacter sp. MIT 99-10781]